MMSQNDNYLHSAINITTEIHFYYIFEIFCINYKA